MSKKYYSKNYSHNIHANFTKVPNELIRTELLTPTDKIIAIVILSYSPSFPSYARIMKEANIGSRSTISKSLQTLKEYGFFEVIQDSQYKSNLYRYIDSQMDSPSPTTVLKPVHKLDTNKTNSIILNNHTNGPSVSLKGSDGPISAADFLKDTIKSLGNGAKYGYKEKTRPTFIIEAMNK